jgi:type IV secretion system protein VirD4
VSIQTDGGSNELAAIIVGFGALSTAAGTLCWAAGQAALLLSGRADGIGAASLTRSPHLVLGLLRGHSPASAWHSTYPAAETPPNLLFWIALNLLLLVLGCAVWLGIARWSTLSQSRRMDPARWATRKQERRLAVPADPLKRPWRLVAGRGHASRRRLAAHDCVSAVVFGPNGSGKTTSLVVPNVLDWDGPVVFTTAKPQDLEPVCRERRRTGPVWVIAPGGAPGHECSGWSPIDAATDPERADRLAEWLVESSGMGVDPKARPWNAQARKYLKGLMLAANLHAADREGGGGEGGGEGGGGDSHRGGGMVQWISWIHAGERARDQVEDILRAAGHHDVAQEYDSTWAIHEEGKGSVLFTALGLADTYSRPGVLNAASRAGFDPVKFLDRNGTLCIVTPNAEGERFAPYFTALLSAVICEAETRAASSRGPLDPRLLLALDEAGNVFRYPRLPHLLTTARGNGIQLLLIYHDLAQVEHLYGGRQVARTVISNAKMRMLLPGVGDLDTLRYWSDLLGQTQRNSQGTTSGSDGRRSRSRSEHTVSLAPLHRLQQLPDGDAVLLYQNSPPARVRLLPWYADPRFRRLNADNEDSP